MHTQDLHLEIPFGIESDEQSRKIKLLPTNGVAEKVFIDKSPTEPYTWMGQVLSVAIERIGDQEIGASARKQKESKDEITIPPVLKSLSLADVNTLLVEIHRRVWESEIKGQEVVCKYCGQLSVFTIDLDRADFTDEHKQLLEEAPYHFVVSELRDGWTFEALQQFQGSSDSKSYEEYEGITYNRFEFRLPQLGDAIRFQMNAEDSVKFWREIASTCLKRVYREEEGTETSELPSELLKYYGIKLFNKILTGRDLKAIRTLLREGIPTMPFSYKDTCPKCRRATPVTFEPSSFFGE